MTEDDMRELSILRRAGWFLALASVSAVVCAVLAGTAGNTPLYTLAAVIVVITGLPALTVPTLIENVKGTK